MSSVLSSLPPKGGARAGAPPLGVRKRGRMKFRTNYEPMAAHFSLENTFRSPQAVSVIAGLGVGHTKRKPKGVGSRQKVSKKASKPAC